MFRLRLCSVIKNSNLTRLVWLKRDWHFQNISDEWARPLLLYNFQKQLPEVFCKKVVLKNFAKFTRKHLCQSLFFWPATLLKKTMAQVLWCEFCKSFKNTFFTEHLRWLLLNFIGSYRVIDAVMLSLLLTLNIFHTFL